MRLLHLVFRLVFIKSWSPTPYIAVPCQTPAFLEIDAVVSMIEKVLENTDSYLQEEFSTRGLASDSDNGK